VHHDIVAVAQTGSVHVGERQQYRSEFRVAAGQGAVGGSFCPKKGKNLMASALFHLDKHHLEHTDVPFHRFVCRTQCVDAEKLHVGALETGFDD